MFEIVKNLPFDTEKTILKDKEIELYIFTPSKLSKRFKDYDLKKNFQIWLKEDGRRFRPNHLRIFIDLNLRARSRPDLKKEILLAFDQIFYGNDPDKEIARLEKEHFEHFLNPLKFIGYMSQLFIIEQEYCYRGKSNFDPPTLFYQGWVRQVLASPREIDNICMSVARRQPPQPKFTSKEDRNHRKYKSNVQLLWYLE